MEKNNNVNNDFDFTIVMDKTYVAPDLNDIQMSGSVKADAPQADAEKPEEKPVNFRKLMDDLYDRYEEMCFREPTVIDKDDIYPHSYQWRARDKYDPSKKDVLEEALKLGRKILDTPAYGEYADDVKKSKSEVSWD